MDTEAIVSLAEMKEHLRIAAAETGFDTDISGKLEAARKHVEKWVGPLDDMADGVPEDIKAALKLFAAHLYAHREAIATDVPAEIAAGFHDLIGPYRAWEF